MSLFDRPSPKLSPVLFGEDEKIRIEAQTYILEDINKILQPGTVVGIYLLGSMAGRQYNDQSDIDINLILRDRLRKADYWEYVKTKNGRFFPGTEHPINYFLQEYSEAKYAETAEYAVYDILGDTWAKHPKKFEDIRDPKEEFRAELRFGNLFKKIYNYKHDPDALNELLERQRKEAYAFGWGTPRESQQNILYKLIERIKEKTK